MSILLEMSLRAEALSMQQHLLDKDYDAKLYSTVKPEWKFVGDRDHFPNSLWLHVTKDERQTLVRFYDLKLQHEAKSRIVRKYSVYVPNVFMPANGPRSWILANPIGTFQELKDVF